MPYESYVPPIEPVSSDYYIACHFFPGWNVRENGYSGLKDIEDFPDRMPLVGYYDEADPEIADWQFKWALEHGINCFIYCWYRSFDNVGHPVTKDGLRLAHEIDAHKASRFGKQMDYAIMWECDNAGGTEGEDDLVNNLLPFWVKEYFNDPNYQKIDGKPVLYLYDPAFKIERKLGEGAITPLVAKLKEKIKDYGFDGLYVYAEHRHADPVKLDKWKERGVDGVFAYCWPTVSHAPSDEEVLADEYAHMDAGIAYDPSFASILTCSQSWDPTPWRRREPNGMTGITRWKLTPNNWRKLLEETKKKMDALPEGAPGKRFVILDNWNEWCEGHYIMPHLSGGFKYLEAVREVFTKRDNLPDYRLPAVLGRGPFDEKIDLTAERLWYTF